MSRKKKDANPTAPRRTVLKRGRLKGRGIKQKDLVPASEVANPTEPLQVRPDDIPQVPTPLPNVRPQFALPLVASAIDVPPPYIPMNPVTSSVYEEIPSPKLEYDPKMFERPTEDPAKETTNSTDDPLLENPYETKYSYDPTKNPYDASSLPLTTNYSYGSKQNQNSSNVTNVLSESTNRFVNALFEFFGGFTNPTNK